MAKSLIFLFCILAFLSAAYTRCPMTCRPDEANLPPRCATDPGGVFCILLAECHVRRINCRLRGSNRPLLNVTSLQNCGNRPLNYGGPCTTQVGRKTRAIRPNCSQIKCSNPSKSLKCYRSRHNRCQLLTQCQLRRINCMRGSQNRLERGNSRRCDGMKPGQSLQKCKSVPKFG